MCLCVCVCVPVCVYVQVRVTEDSSPLGDNEIAARAAARQKEAARARTALMTAWGLAAVSAVHHAGHVLHLLVRRAYAVNRTHAKRAPAGIQHFAQAYGAQWLFFESGINDASM